MTDLVFPVSPDFTKEIFPLWGWLFFPSSALSQASQLTLWGQIHVSMCTFLASNMLNMKTEHAPVCLVCHKGYIWDPLRVPIVYKFDTEMLKGYRQTARINENLSGSYFQTESPKVNFLTVVFHIVYTPCAPISTALDCLVISSALLTSKVLDYCSPLLLVWNWLHHCVLNHIQ